VRHKKVEKTHTSSEKQKLKKNSYLREAKKSGEKLIPEMRHKK
jgi:hypothetical protein